MAFSIGQHTWQSRNRCDEATASLLLYLYRQSHHALHIEGLGSKRASDPTSVHGRIRAG
ncbi:MAG: hypothetical protein ACO1SX_07965 [Actinomycetota bacterium]